MGDEYVNDLMLQSKFPKIYRTTNVLVLHFMFYNLGDCNLPFGA